MTSNNNGWDKWGTHIKKELERLNHEQINLDNKLDAGFKELYKALNDISIKVAGNSVKLGFWGGSAGILSMLITLIYLWAKQ